MATHVAAPVALSDSQALRTGTIFRWSFVGRHRFFVQRYHKLVLTRELAIADGNGLSVVADALPDHTMEPYSPRLLPQVLRVLAVERGFLFPIVPGMQRHPSPSLAGAIGDARCSIVLGAGLQSSSETAFPPTKHETDETPTSCNKPGDIIATRYTAHSLCERGWRPRCRLWLAASGYNVSYVLVTTRYWCSACLCSDACSQPC